MDPSTFGDRADLGLAWGVKESFLRYVRGMPDGAVRWRDGAAVTSDGEFYFPLARASGARAARVLEFRGEVRFVAHRGLLSVTFKNPVVRMGESSGELRVRNGAGEETIGALQPPPPIVDGHVAMWQQTPVSLAGAGPELFGGAYAAGEPLAPLTVRAPVDPTPGGGDRGEAS